MANKNTIRVAEFEKLYYDANKPFKEKHWLALCRYQEKQYLKGEGGAQYFRILKQGVQFTNYVGVIQAGNLTIEVLPKTDRANTTASNSTVRDLEDTAPGDAGTRQCWHNVLLQMLKECRLLQVSHVDNASLNLKSNSILEIYIELFLAHTERILHEGLIKKYKKEEGNRLAMKGQLLFAKNIAQNLVHQERFYIRHTEYNRTNIYNQLLYKTLCLLPAITNTSSLADKVNRLLLDFPEMPDCKVTSQTFDKLFFDRKTERYREALLISKMLLLNFRPDISGGTENVMAILFDMNKLWEEFVYRRLVKAAGEGFSVSRQNRKPFWYNTSDAFYTHVKPDMVVQKNGKIIVLDTKWKMIDTNRPGDDDLKQMFVYNLMWDAEKSFLIYPGTYDTCEGSYLHFKLSGLSERKDEKYANHCSLAFINVLNEHNKLTGNEPFLALLNML